MWRGVAATVADFYAPRWFISDCFSGGCYGQLWCQGWSNDGSEGNGGSVTDAIQSVGKVIGSEKLDTFVSIAAINGPRKCVISGSNHYVKLILDSLPSGVGSSQMGILTPFTLPHGDDVALGNVFNSVS